METATLVAMIAAAAALLGHFVKQHLDCRLDVLKEQHARKIPIYTELLEAVQAVLQASQAKEGS